MDPSWLVTDVLPLRTMASLAKNCANTGLSYLLALRIQDLA